MPEATDRPADVGRKHRRRTADPATASLLTRYQQSMRAHLGALLDELDPKPAEPGLGLVPVPPKTLSVSQRAEHWKLAILLGRELGSAIEPIGPTPDSPTRATPRSRARVDYGGS